MKPREQPNAPPEPKRKGDAEKKDRKRRERELREKETEEWSGGETQRSRLDKERQLLQPARRP